MDAPVSVFVQVFPSNHRGRHIIDRLGAFLPPIAIPTKVVKGVSCCRRCDFEMNGVHAVYNGLLAAMYDKCLPGCRDIQLPTTNAEARLTVFRRHFNSIVASAKRRNCRSGCVDFNCLFLIQAANSQSDGSL
jgi:hypothetical protein